MVFGLEEQGALQPALFFINGLFTTQVFPPGRHKKGQSKFYKNIIRALFRAFQNKT